MHAHVQCGGHKRKASGKHDYETLRIRPSRLLKNLFDNTLFSHGIDFRRDSWGG